MKTTEKKFNWLTRLEEIVADPRSLSAQERQQLCDRAHNWPTCACGQLCKRLPRTPLGAPEDIVLRGAGLAFSLAVGASEWDKALEIFKKIEARSEELLVYPVRLRR